MSTVREVLTTWGFDVNTSDLDKAEAKFKSLTKTFAIIAGAGVAVGAGLFAMVKKTADYGDEVWKTSQKIGIATDSLQKFHYIAKLSDVSNEQFNKGVQRLSISMTDASRGSQLALEAFRDIGITQDMLKDKSMTAEKMLLLIADRFNEMPDGIKKTNAAVKIFSRAGAEMIPMLNMGSVGMSELAKEYVKLGTILDDDTLRLGEEFNDNLSRIKTGVQGLVFQIGSKLLPRVNELVVKVLNWYQANRKLVDSKLNEYVEKLWLGLQGLYRVGERIASVFDVVSRVFGGMENTIMAVAIALGAMVAANMIKNVIELAVALKAVAGSLALVQASTAIIAAKITIIVAALTAIYDFYKFISRQKSIIGGVVGIDPDAKREKYTEMLKNVPASDWAKMEAAYNKSGSVDVGSGGAKSKTVVSSPSIVINAPAGADNRDLAGMVKQELDNHFQDILQWSEKGN